MRGKRKASRLFPNPEQIREIDDPETVAELLVEVAEVIGTIEADLDDRADDDPEWAERAGKALRVHHRISGALRERAVVLKVADPRPPFDGTAEQAFMDVCLSQLAAPMLRAIWNEVYRRHPQLKRAA